MNIHRMAATLILAAALLLAAGSSTAHAADVTNPPTSDLESLLSGYIGGLAGNYGVAGVDLTSGTTWSVNGDTAFPTASMYKLLVMYRVFEAVDAGDLSPHDTVIIIDEDMEAADDGEALFPGDAPTIAEALDAMITVSSNAAAYALAREVGGWGSIASVPAELGMPNTGLYDDFESTPNDLAHFFVLLAGGSLVGSSASQQMMGLLLGQSSSDRIPALLPGYVAVAHKTGELDGVRNDGGIVFAPQGMVVLVLMSQGGSEDEEIAAEATMARMVYDALW